MRTHNYCPPLCCIVVSVLSLLVCLCSVNGRVDLVSPGFLLVFVDAITAARAFCCAWKQAARTGGTPEQACHVCSVAVLCLPDARARS